MRKAHYTAERLAAVECLSLEFDRPYFKEFVVRAPQGLVEPLLERAYRDDGLLAGVPLGRWYPELADCFLVTVTEKRSRDEIDCLAESLSDIHVLAATHHA